MNSVILFKPPFTKKEIVQCEKCQRYNTRKNIATAITAASNVQVLILQINALNQQKLLRNVSTVKETTQRTTKAA
jgi:hypothetical protein